MSDSKNSQQSSKPDPALRLLDMFVGTWKTEGEIKADGDTPAIPIEGTDTYEWLPGGYFLFHQVDIRMGGEQIDSVEIIGYDPANGKYPMHYFGYQGSKGIMYATVEKNTWIFAGETERFTGSFNDSGTVISGKWERLDGSKWVHWMDIKLTKIT